MGAEVITAITDFKVMNLARLFFSISAIFTGWGGEIWTHISRFRGVLPTVLGTAFLPLEYSPIFRLFIFLKKSQKPIRKKTLDASELSDIISQYVLILG